MITVELLHSIKNIISIDLFNEAILCALVLQHMSLSVDMLNVMVLHAFVPDSLLHVNIRNIHLASEKTMSSDIPTLLAGSLSLESVEGKILKSPKEVKID